MHPEQPGGLLAINLRVIGYNVGRQLSLTPGFIPGKLIYGSYCDQPGFFPNNTYGPHEISPRIHPGVKGFTIPITSPLQRAYHIDHRAITPPSSPGPTPKPSSFSPPNLMQDKNQQVPRAVDHHHKHKSRPVLPVHPYKKGHPHRVPHKKGDHHIIG